MPKAIKKLEDVAASKDVLLYIPWYDGYERI